LYSTITHLSTEFHWNCARLLSRNRASRKI
jgi:hypothetical protein